MNARAQAHTDFTRTTVIRPSTPKSVNVKMKEDAGVSIDADRPYNFVERMFLRLLGTLTARQLI
jgi:2',3'-cyclic-nucleotide 2'-phosphodiesterase (5'-nucleotidase family)